jgi:hypothetical protein
MLYPNHRHMLPWTTIQRELLLPETAIGRTDSVKGQQVSFRDIVARGTIPARFIFIDAMQILRLRKPEDLDDLILSEIGVQVESGEVIAGARPDRGRRVFAPAAGIFMYAGAPSELESTGIALRADGEPQLPTHGTQRGSIRRALSSGLRRSGLGGCLPATSFGNQLFAPTCCTLAQSTLSQPDVRIPPLGRRDVREGPRPLV